MTLAKDRLLWAVFIANSVVTAWTESEVIWVFIISGLLAMVVKAPPRSAAATSLLSVGPLPLWAITGLLGPASVATLTTIAWYFAEAGAFVFGSGLAIVPFLQGGVVTRFHWLTDQQFLDAVAVAMITRGPVVITVAFIGYLVAGPIGACVAALATFVPCYLFTIVPAPYFRRFAKNPSLKAFVDGVTAASSLSRHWSRRLDLPAPCSSRAPRSVRLLTTHHILSELARFWISATVAASSPETFTAKPVPVEVTFALTPLTSSRQ
jgi:chromate transporter